MGKLVRSGIYLKSKANGLIAQGAKLLVIWRSVHASYLRFSFGSVLPDRGWPRATLSCAIKLADSRFIG
jgi:hypothetical protein